VRTHEKGEENEAKVSVFLALLLASRAAAVAEQVGRRWRDKRAVDLDEVEAVGEDEAKAVS